MRFSGITSFLRGDFEGIVAAFLTGSTSVFVWGDASVQSRRVQIGIIFFEEGTLGHLHLRVGLSQLHEGDFFAILEHVLLKGEGWGWRRGARETRGFLM